MRFDIERVADVIVVDIRGPLVGGPDAPSLHEAVKECITDGARRFVVDFKRCNVCSSSGIGVLIAARGSILAAGGSLRLCNVKGRVRTSLVVMGVLQLFEVYESRDEALVSSSPV